MASLGLRPVPDDPKVPGWRATACARTQIACKQMHLMAIISYSAMTLLKP